MPKAELGHLTTVNLTDAWNNEPHDFTPWLAQNIDRLAKAVGVPLSDPQMEVKTDQSGADRFCADIVATSPDGESVLIESQFTDSDHGHLGQIMTYLAGVKAKIIIWIAPKFRESHLSAIRWLNSNTQDEYAFFAVELRVVRIADSMMAPLFDVIERPNQWERQLLEKQREIATPQISERREFWDTYLRIHPNAAEDMGGGGRGSTRWREVPGTGMYVARWFLGDGVGLFVRGARGEGYDAFYELPKDVQKRIVARLSVELDENDYALSKYWEQTINGRQDWPAAIEWLEAETQRYVNVIKDEIGEVA